MEHRLRQLKRQIMMVEPITGKCLDVRRFFNQELQDFRQMAQTPAPALVGGDKDFPVITAHKDKAKAATKKLRTREIKSVEIYEATNLTFPASLQLSEERRKEMEDMINRPLVQKKDKNSQHEIYILKHIQEQDASKRTHIIKSFMATSDPDGGDHAQGPHLYMECAQYGDARNFFDFIHNRNMEGDQLQSCQSFYINQMMASVTQLHNLNIAHLNLKPENFVVMSNGSLKLIDFGFSALSQSTLNLPEHLPPYCCTPGYDAPETKDFKTRNFDFEDLKKIDLWAIGAIIAFDLMKFEKEKSDEIKKEDIFDKANQVNKVNAQRLTSISLSLKDRFLEWWYDQGRVSTQGVIKQLIQTLVAEKEERGSQISRFYIEKAEGLYNIKKREDLPRQDSDTLQYITSSMTLDDATWSAWKTQLQIVQRYGFY